MTQMSAFDKFLLLSWKNWLIQFRRPIQTVLEIMIPVLVCAFLVLIRVLVEVEKVEFPLIFSPTEMEWIDDAHFINMTRGIVNNTQGVPPHRLFIAYSPMNPFLHQIVTNVNDQMGFLGVIPQPNALELENNAIQRNPFVSIEFDDNLAGDVSLPSSIHYALRFPAELRRNDSVPNDAGAFSSNWGTNIRFGIDFIPGPRNGASIDGGQPPGYIRVKILMLRVLKF
jgi:ATP-binding cassette, subfamily A (ABC1), member 3